MFLGINCGRSLLSARFNLLFFHSSHSLCVHSNGFSRCHNVCTLYSLMLLCSKLVNQNHWSYKLCESFVDLFHCKYTRLCSRYRLQKYSTTISVCEETHHNKKQQHTKCHNCNLLKCVQQFIQAIKNVTSLCI